MARGLRSRVGRASFQAVACLISILLPWGPTGRAAAAESGSFRLVSADATGVTLEYTAPEPVFTSVTTPFGIFQRIDLADHALLTDLGRPALPSCGAGLAIPEGVEPRLSFEILERRDISGLNPLPAPDGPTSDPESVVKEGSFAIDQGWYAHGAPWPETQVRYTERGHLRSHRVGQVSVCPVQWDPATGVAAFLKRVRIRVDFAPARAGAPSGGLKGSGGTPSLEYAPVGEEPAWEDTYRNAFLNYESARSFRVRPLPVIERDGSGLPGDEDATAPAGSGSARRTAAVLRPRAASATNPEFRIYVGLTGPVLVTCADLVAAGWPEDVPADQIHLYEKSCNATDPSRPLIREVPILMVDTTGVAGVFDADDNFYFYGLNFEDRFNPPQVTARFTRLHAYWLSWWPEAGARMATAPGWFDAASFVTPTSYLHHTHWEEDIDYTYMRAAGSTSSSEFPQEESTYWLGPSVYRDSLSFSTPGREISLPFRLRARWLGVFSGNHYSSVWLTRGCTTASDTLLFYKQNMGTQSIYDYDSGRVLPGARLADGCNRFKYQGNGFANGDPNSTGSGAYFDWFDVDYHRRYVASGGILRFTSGSATGNVEFSIRGLSAEVPLVFDVTDSLAPRQVDLSGAAWTDLGGRPKEYQLRFRAEVGSQRTYVLYEPGVIPLLRQAVTRMPPDLGSTNIAAVPASDITTDTGADVLVITHPSFQAELQPWIALRQSQGHTITVVTPQQIWDQFSGGNKSVTAIRDWLRWVYRHRTTPPDYLLLFGDASEDYRKDLGLSKPDWVPTMMRFGPVPGSDSRYELISSDNWYVATLGSGDPEYDLLPDLHVGRLTPGSAEEARSLVAKLVAYDNYSAEDAWRNRGLLVSDDAYSTSISGTGNYCFRYEDLDFEAGGDTLANLFATRGCYAGFTLEHLRLREIMNVAAAALGRTNLFGNCTDQAANTDYAREHATPVWLEQSNQGQLFQIFSGHGNRLVMTTERIVEFSGNLLNPENRTPDSLTNYGRPFIYIGVGCHLNDFKHYMEASYLAGLGERMVLLPNRGAIASMASTGYEWTPTNKWVEIYLGRVLFMEHPRDPATGRPRRILGEGFDQALLRLLVTKTGDPLYYGVFASYCLLGDPTMRIDMAPPRLQVEVDGVPKNTGDKIVPGSGPTTITARVSDDVDYRNGGFSITDGDSTIPSSAWTAVPYDDTREGACRGMLVTWAPELRLANYAIVLKATDWLDREMEFTLNVKSIEVAYRLRSPAPGNELTEVTADEIIPADGRLEITATSLADLSPADFEVRVNGTGGYFTWSAGSTEANTWVATPSQDLPTGKVTLEVLIRGKVFDSRVVRVENRTLLTEVYFYPNPVQARETGRFIYQLAYPAAGESPTRARVLVFSVSGRKVATLEGPAGVGRNALGWDLRDQQGDEVANGVYLYKLAVEFPSGKKLTTIDRLVIHR